MLQQSGPLLFPLCDDIQGVNVALIKDYITCYSLDAFIQSDLHTQFCGQSPQEQFGVKCLSQGHNDMLTAVGFEPVPP